jgi:hypothetical protein
MLAIQKSLLARNMAYSKHKTVVHTAVGIQVGDSLQVFCMPIQKLLLHTRFLRPRDSVLDMHLQEVDTLLGKQDKHWDHKLANHMLSDK